MKPTTHYINKSILLLFLALAPLTSCTLNNNPIIIQNSSDHELLTEPPIKESIVKSVISKPITESENTRSNKEIPIQKQKIESKNKLVKKSCSKFVMPILVSEMPVNEVDLIAIKRDDKKGMIELLLHHIESNHIRTMENAKKLDASLASHLKTCSGY